MELSDAIKLIAGVRGNTGETPETWVDLGCGSGLFTYALANLLPSESLIYAVDKLPGALESHPNPNQVIIRRQQLDFVQQALDWRELDGVMMANSLHFVRDKPAFFEKLFPCLKKDGTLLLVEYDTDRSNPWVPFPVSYSALVSLLQKPGQRQVLKLRDRPSLYGRATIYAALCKRI